MTPERFQEIKTGVPLSEPTCYTRVIQECVDEIERLQTISKRTADGIGAIVKAQEDVLAENARLQSELAQVTKERDAFAREFGGGNVVLAMTNCQAAKAATEGGA